MTEPAPQTLCNACKAELLRPGAAFCKECKAWQGKQCVFCKHWLPIDAKHCNDCGMYQAGWRSVFTLSQTVLALLVALIALISPGINAVFWALDRNSSTSAIVTGFDTDAASVYLWNTGRKPSRVEKCVLDFGTLPYGRMELDVSDRTHSFIPPAGPGSVSGGVPLKLDLRRLKERCTAEKASKSAATLFVYIRESNNDLNTQRLRLSESDVDKINLKATVEKVDPCT